MSVQALTWVLDRSEAEGSERLCLISLANHAHKDGTHAFPTTKTVAGEAKVSVRTAKYCLDALEAGGAIERTGIGPNRAVEYRIDMGERGLAYRTQTHKATRQREGATVAPTSEGAAVAPPGVQPATDEGATDGRVLIKPSENRPLTVTPQPPKGERPVPPNGRRDRDHVAYRRALAEWCPCAPAADLERAWATAAAELRAAVTDSMWTLWLHDVHPHAFAEGTLYVGASKSTATTVADRFGRLIHACAGVGIAGVHEVEVLVCDEQPAQVVCLHPDHPHQEGHTHAADGRR